MTPQMAHRARSPGGRGPWMTSEPSCTPWRQPGRPCAPSRRARCEATTTLSRREAAGGTLLLTLLLGGSGRADEEGGDPSTMAMAPEAQVGEGAEPTVAPSLPRRPTRVYLDVEVDGEPLGRVVVALDREGTPEGTKRFLELATGDLRACMQLPNPLVANSLIDFIEPGQVLKTSGPTTTRLKATMLRCEEAAERAGAGTVREALERELKSQGEGHAAGEFLLSIKVRQDPGEVEAPTGKLVSRNGKLEVVADSPRAELMPLPPSGTAFAITLPGAQPALLEKLDATNLIVGSVPDEESRDVLRRIASLPINRNNSDNAFFKAGKSAGDGRAKVAERGFNRPFSTIRIVGSGAI